MTTKLKDYVGEPWRGRDEAKKGDDKDEDGGGGCASHEPNWENFLLNLIKLKTDKNQFQPKGDANQIYMSICLKWL